MIIFCQPGWLRGHGAENLLGDVCWSHVRHGRGACCRPSGPSHRLKLCHVLFTHTGILLFLQFIFGFELWRVSSSLSLYQTLSFNPKIFQALHNMR